VDSTVPTPEAEVRVSTLELFFDLVFVFTLTQMTGLLAADPDWSGLLKVVLLLSVTWWIYDGYVWLTNSLALDALGHRLLLLGGMGGFLIMALAIPTTFDEGGVAFGVGYLAVVALHSGLYLRATSASQAAAIRGIVPYNVAAALALLAAGLVDGAAKWTLFTAAAVVLWAVPFIVAIEGFRITASHFAERHGLVIIVALGESIVVLGVGAAGEEVGLELGLISLLALALSASLWWTYFSNEGELERGLEAAPEAGRPRLAVNAFGYAHFFLLLGVVLLAAGLKKAIPDPLEPLSDGTAAVLAVGTAMFLAANAWLLRLLHLPHGGVLLVASVVSLATIPLGAEASAWSQLAALTAVVAAAIVSDRRRAGTARPTAR
jgi:low temperature requirement protein LtrA